MTPYTLIESPVFVRKEGVENGPKEISFYGACPQNRDDYEIKHRLALRDDKKNTTHNYFFGIIARTTEEFETIIAKLRERGHVIDDSILKTLST